MADSRFDERLVIHEVGILIVAALCGTIVMFIDSIAVGTLAAAVTAVLGHVILRISPLRRGINRLAYGIREVSR